MKKIKIKQKLQLNKAVVSTLNNTEMNVFRGGKAEWTGSIGLKCTQRDGGCSVVYTNLTKGWACNDTRATLCNDSQCIPNNLQDNLQE